MADVYTEIASDALVTGTAGQALTDYSSNWTETHATHQFYFATLSPEDGLTTTPSTALGTPSAYWNDDSFPANQYAQVTRVAVNRTLNVGVAVRMTGNTFYAYIGGRDQRVLVKVIAGVTTTLGTNNNSDSGDNVLRLEVVGTTLRPLINGVLDSVIGTVNDADISSGSAGIYGIGDDEQLGLIHTWSAGSITSSRRARVAAINVGFPYARFPVIPDNNLDNEADRAWLAGFYSGLVSEDAPFSTEANIGRMEDGRDAYRFAALGTAYRFEDRQAKYSFAPPATAYRFADGRSRYFFERTPRE